MTEKEPQQSQVPVYPPLIVGQMLERLTDDVGRMAIQSATNQGYNKATFAQIEKQLKDLEIAIAKITQSQVTVMESLKLLVTGIDEDNRC
jgi:hypothetical protein